MKIRITRKLWSLFPYLTVSLVTLFILFLVLHLWDANISIPFTYGGDAMLNLIIIKGIIEHGWFFTNNNVGMPSGLELYDFPMADNFNYLILKALTYVTPNSSAAMNIFYILTFPMTAVASLITVKKFIKSNIIAITCSLLFAFLPYHFLRGESHLFLSAYYMIPLVVLIILWLSTENDLFIGENSKPFYKRITNRLLASIIICAIVSSTGVYYAVFSCFFIALVGVTSAIYFKSIKKILITLILLGVIFLGLLASFAPNFIYMSLNGKSSEVAQRNIGESEIYGLKITQLLFPTDNHRISKIAYLKQRYLESTPLNTENTMSSLGFIGSIGFLMLILYLFFRKKEHLLHNLSIINISALLLSTIGGFGTIIAFLISPEIRAYNRISIFIAFFSLFALFSVLDRIKLKFDNSQIKKISYSGFILFILCVGLLDQTNKSHVPIYQWYTAEFNNDKHFVEAIESQVPTNTEIFQLPYVPFPENPPVNKLGDYELFRGYVHSTSLKWSYGAMKGREGDLWQKELSTKSLDIQLETISIAGFGGVYLDRNGYADNGLEMEANLNALLGYMPIESENKRLLFYNLEDYNTKMKNKFTKDEWVTKKEATLHPIYVTWSNSQLEGTTDNNWRWFPSEAELTINNTSSQNIKLTINMGVSTGYDEPSNLSLSSSLFTDTVQLNNSNTLYNKTLVIPKGIHTIKLLSDAKQIDAPTDPRTLVFRITNFHWKVEN